VSALGIEPPLDEMEARTVEALEKDAHFRQGYGEGQWTKGRWLVVDSRRCLYNLEHELDTYRVIRAAMTDSPEDAQDMTEMIRILAALLAYRQQQRHESGKR
jgi:hypothetical protein